MKKMISILFFATTLILISCTEKTNNNTTDVTSSSIYKIEEGFVDANGVLIYYKMFGKGQPLLIVHGGPGATHDYFLPYLVPLARNNKLIFIDERGSGSSCSGVCSQISGKSFTFNTLQYIS